LFAGVTPFEILFSHVITQFVVMCGQTALVLIFMILVFGVECKGDVFSAVILTILQGLCGMCFGKWPLCTSYLQAYGASACLMILSVRSLMFSYLLLSLTPHPHSSTPILPSSQGQGNTNLFLCIKIKV
jgi:hypothetical protein